MKVAIYEQVPLTATRSTAREAVSPSETWVQFGKQFLMLTSEANWDALTDRAQNEGLVRKSEPQDVNLSELYLIWQKGRMFQSHFPQVPIIMERGRYLVVKIADESTKRAIEEKAMCYTLRPLPINSVVFHEISRPSARVESDPVTQEFVDAIDRTRFMDTLTLLTKFRTRHSFSQEYQSAAQWCLGELQTMGYNARLEEISVGTRLCHNVVAEKAGSQPPEQKKSVLLTAHLDSINSHKDDDLNAVAPGADDNGTGSAGLMEVARVLQGLSFSHDLRLVLFGGEEQGLHGSTDYVSSLSESDRTRIKAVINMDMIGGLNTEKPSVTLESSITFSDMINDLTSAGHTYSSLNIEVSWHYFNSDHVPFIDAGIPAVLTIEGVDTANHFVHSSEDTIEHVSDRLAVEILRMNTAFLLMNLQ
jgi:hypothetical protein